MSSYEAALSVHADKILGANPAIPLDIERVCEHFELTLLHKKIGQFRAYLAKEDVGGLERFFILLPDRGRGSSYERFCIAHELAHYILLMQFGTAVPAEINHWETEALCDNFARRVLVPDRLLHYRIRTQLDTAYLALQTVDRIARIAGVPWFHAARRIQEHQRALFFLRLQIARDRRLKVVATTLSGNKEINRLVRADSAWSVLVHKMTTGSGCELRTLEQVDEVIVASSGIPSLEMARKVALCVDNRGQKPEIRVAAVCA